MFLFFLNIFLQPARGIVGRVTDSGVRGLGFKSQGSILTYVTETSSLPRVVRDCGDPFSAPLSRKKVSCGGVFDLAVEQPQLFKNHTKTKKKLKRTADVMAPRLGVVFRRLVRLGSFPV